MSDPMVTLSVRVPRDVAIDLDALAAEVSAGAVTPTKASTIARLAIDAGLPVVRERVRNAGGRHNA